ncbi:hypothetical protein E1B28_004067 [Marasmius oreades]|uniref:Uncharacterized protein n=1 Tax=Marasmius oreades TaxID=181124 RepID=A0A9P7UXT9_9AGAR|nr:uncharacterized protein E1B28_004067 [Marasmius oreades]KAG7096651.1 hypothetical protein E1B28_004067 [Marasmius oreades]
MPDTWSSGGKRKRKQTLRGQASLAREMAAASRNTDKTAIGNDQDPLEDGYTQADKENDLEAVTSVQQARGDHFKAERDKFSKKARYWKGETEESRKSDSEEDYYR